MLLTISLFKAVNKLLIIMIIVCRVVLHGENILQTIENLSTTYESPDNPIIIETCDVYNFIKPPNEEFMRDHENYFNNQQEVLRKATETHINSCDTLSTKYFNYPADIQDYRDVDSIK